MICELLSMCIPFEMRFIASFLEEQGRHSYQELRQQTLSANDVEKLEKDALFKNQSLHDELVRHRILINISLLKSRNYSVANWYSNKFLRTDYIEELIHKEKDDLVQNELLLLFTMAARHPAFSFEQKQFFSRILVQLYDIRDSRFINKSCAYGYPPGFGYPTLYKKVHDSTPLPMGFPMHPLGLPHLDFMTHFRSWPGLPCGAPAEVPPFPPHQTPLQPPQPSTSPLVSSPSQSRSTSPHRTPMVSRSPTLSIITNPAPSIGIPPVLTPSAPGLPPPGGAGTVLSVGPPGPGIPPPVVSIPMPVSMDTLTPPQLSQSSQLSPIYSQVKQGQPDSDELNTTLKEESPKLPMINPWMGQPGSEMKQINGMRIPPFPQSNIRTSIADQMQSMALTDESSHYHSSSSNSSPLQTPPDTPSNLPSTVATPHGPGRGIMDKNRVNGMPNFMPPFGDTTSPPPPPAFTFPTYAPMPPARYYTNAGFRPPVTTVFGQYAAGQQYQGQVQAGTETTSYPTTYSIPYFSLMYSSFPPAANPPMPPRNPPGCYNCGATGHLGQDCPQQNIEEITQKKTFSVDFSPVQSDGGEK